MTSNVNTSSSSASHPARWVLAVFAVAAIVAPALYFSRGPTVQAEDPPKPKASGPKEPDVEFFPKPSASEEKILAAFEQPTELSFHETALQAAVDFLNDKHSIEIQIDSKALEDSGMKDNTPVTCKVSGVSLRSGLRLMLSRIDLEFLIRDEVLLITTQEVADAELVTRTYPVADLTPGNQYDDLIEAITTTVVPQSWDEVGGPGNLTSVEAAKSLVISQTQNMQDEVLQLLRSLRAARKAGGVEWSDVQAEVATPVSTGRPNRQRGGGVVGGGVVGGGRGTGGVGVGATKDQDCTGEKSKAGKATGGGMF